MANRLAEYRDSNNLTDDQVASELHALLGKKITGAGVRAWANRKTGPPKAWAAALNLPPEEGTFEPDEPLYAPEDFTTFGPAPEPASDEPPMMPPNARHAPARHHGSDYGLVRERIGKAYQAIGAGATMVSGNPGYSAVADAFSDDLAKAWIDAAEQNANIRKIVAFMESGGPVGELVIAHVILVLGFAYVSGRASFASGILGHRFDGFHSAAYNRRAADIAAAEAETNGRQHGPDAESGAGPVAPDRSRATA